MPRYHIDGTMPDGTLHDDPKAIYPYAVFDEVKQDWLLSGLTYERAWLITTSLNRHPDWTPEEATLRSLDYTAKETADA